MQEMKADAYRNTSHPKPSDRKWNLLGMALGVVVAFAASELPEPLRSFLLWIWFGAVLGLILVLWLFTRAFFISMRKTRFGVWRLLIFTGSLGGAGVGIGMWMSGNAMPDDVIIGAITSGMLAGYAITEMQLRRIDEGRRRMYRAVTNGLPLREIRSERK